MKINIYYGGRGIVGDPSLFVLGKMESVLSELNVKVDRYNLYEEKKNITSLPSTLSDADGVILCTTLEWFGIGGLMTQFLDACWFYGNKSKIEKIYMCPVVMSNAYGERYAVYTLQSAWSTLGGKPCDGISAYVKDPVAFELNQEYVNVIERATENFYRVITRKQVTLPQSNVEIKNLAPAPVSLELTPQETEQLSIYASDENYVQTQKEDIKELTSHFKTLMKNNGVSEEQVILERLQNHFKPGNNVEASYKFEIKGYQKPLILAVKDSDMKCYYGDLQDPLVLCKLKSEQINKITTGQISFQQSFMSGDMQVRGDFRILRLLDNLFSFAPAQ